MSPDPVISIVTVVFNGEAYLEKTIQSVLQQDYPNIDFVIVDGQSSDNTVAIIRRYENKLRWISEPDKGIYDAMNKGIGLARGHWINFLNGGDTYVSNDTLTKLFAQKDLGDVQLLYGDSFNVVNGKATFIPARDISRDTLRRELGLCHQALFVRREFCPRYDLSYRYKSEYNWVIDIVALIPIEAIRHERQAVVNYELGGFSEKGLIRNLKEYIRLTRSRYGVGQVILNVVIYLRILLRAWKYKFIGY